MGSDFLNAGVWGDQCGTGFSREYVFPAKAGPTWVPCQALLDEIGFFTRCGISS
ncbi:hypothetical protein M2401_000632 [Pseudomonas sp. JUb42]|jgi:hypothetical protein|nr:hypothetical protein [Pseudomonas sp. JUb42]